MAAARILLVEDEAVVRLHLAECLKSFGYQVVGTAASGADAVARALALRPDLILMDIRLQDDVDGIEAAGRIRAELDVPVVFLTAFADEPTVARAREVGAYGYVLKPFEEPAVRAAVETALSRHRLDSKLRLDEEWLSGLVGSIGDAVVAAGPDGRVTFVNPAAEHLTGRPVAAAVGRPLAEVVPLVNPPWAGPARLRRADGGERLVDARSAPLRVGDGPAGEVVVFRDVSERERLAEALRRVQKLEAASRLAAGIAHGFNNLLTVILGGCEVLAADPCAATAPETLREVRAAGERAAALARHLATFSGGRPAAPVALSVNAALARAVPLLERVAGESVRVRAVPAPDDAHVRIDPGQFEEVLVHLASNARDAMPAGGQLTLAAGTVFRPGDGPWVRVAVTDTGGGFSAEARERLFEPFFSTKPAGVGTGLGLAAVLAAVRQAGGAVEVMPGRGGGGTTVELFLPRVEPAPVADAPAVPAAAAPASAAVLVVEDEDAIRALVRATLARAGYRVLEAATAEEASAVAAGHPIDLLLTDVMLPGEKGPALAARLRADRPGLRVLFVSGYAAGEAGLPEGDFLAKPFALSELVSRVAAALAAPAGAGFTPRPSSG